MRLAFFNAGYKNISCNKYQINQCMQLNGYVCPVVCYFSNIRHRSAGVGQTGTVIVLDRLLRHIEDHDDVDVYGSVLLIRKHRANMVQNEVRSQSNCVVITRLN